MASIFISYRRGDTGGHAGRLCDRLTARFGGDRVFMDIQDIHPGQNFATSIDETIATCDCVVAVIGPHWLEMVRQRAQAGDDFVRHEIAAALKRGITVIPVMVGGARMPAANQLPPELSELSRRQAIEIRDDRFDNDVVLLEESLASQLRMPDGRVSAGRARLSRGLAIAVPLLVIALGLAGYRAFRPAVRSVAGDPVNTISDAAPPAIQGEWIAQMQKPGQPPFRIRLSFQQLGAGLAGVVRYPTGDGPIHDAVLKGRTLTFSTRHVPQFESTPSTIRFRAEVGDQEIRLLATDDAGVATGVATRVDRQQPPAH
jgi:TIR domain